MPNQNANRVTLLVLMGLTATGVSGCATTPETATTSATQSVAATVWTLEAIYTPADNTNVALSADLKPRHTVQFEDGRLVLQLDCNRGFANWAGEFPKPGTVQDLSIDRVASSRALCPGPSYGEQMARDLPGAQKFGLSVEGDELVIITNNAQYRFLKP